MHEDVLRSLQSIHWDVPTLDGALASRLITTMAPPAQVEISCRTPTRHHGVRAACGRERREATRNYPRHGQSSRHDDDDDDDMWAFRTSPAAQCDPYLLQASSV